MSEQRRLCDVRAYTGATHSDIDMEDGSSVSYELLTIDTEDDARHRFFHIVYIDVSLKRLALLLCVRQIIDAIRLNDSIVFALLYFFRVNG